MDLRRGKTMRRCIQHIPQDSLLDVSSYDETISSSVSLFGFEFRSHVMYSTKKKMRWTILDVLTKEGFQDQDQFQEKVWPVTFSKHQCIVDRRPVSDVYFFDSISSKEVGSPFVSNKVLKGGFNGTSVEKELENLDDKMTRMERERFEKLKMAENNDRRRRRKRGVTRKHHRTERVEVPDEIEEVPRERERKEGRVRVKEYVHMNDLSRINLESPDNWRRKRRRMGGKRRTRKSLEEWKERREDEEEECEEECIEEGWREEDRIEERREGRPFVMREEDLMVQRDHPWTRTRMRRKKKIKEAQRTQRKMEWSPTRVHQDERKEGAPSEEDLDEGGETLPGLSLCWSAEDLVHHLRTLASKAPCWISDSHPSIILVDLDQDQDTKYKNFLSLKPTWSKKKGLVNVKMVLNTNTGALLSREIQDQRFHNILQLVTFLQTKLTRDNTNKRTWSRNFITLDGKVDGLINLWKTKECDAHELLYLDHEEWRGRELREESLDSISRCLSQDEEEEEEEEGHTCVVCLEDVSREEVVRIGPCGHVLCEKCIQTHVLVRLRSGMKDIICPGDGCEILLDGPLVLSLVSWRIYRGRLDLLESEVISRRGGTTCIYCGSVLLGVDPGIQYRCICGRMLCARCGQGRHFPSSCSEAGKYLVKMRQLKDVDIIPVKVRPLVFSGRPCPKCFKFVVKDGGCNHLSCFCGMSFCWGCGDSMNEGKHKSRSFPCPTVEDLETYDLTQHFVTPSSIRPRLYCTALHQKIMTSNYEAMIFNQNLIKILSSGSFLNGASQIPDQLSEISVVIEHIFVKAYQMDRRKERGILLYLKNSATLFLFYQRLIHDMVQSTHTLLKASKSKRYSAKGVSTNLRKLYTLVNEVQYHLLRFSNLWYNDLKIL